MKKTSWNKARTPGVSQKGGRRMPLFPGTMEVAFALAIMLVGMITGNMPAPYRQ
jgi:hypothetical protein